MKTSDLILVDTSAWILALRGEDDGATSTVDRLLAENRVAIADVIIVEILKGARNTREFRDLEKELSALPILPVKESTWKLASKTGYELRRKGANVPTVDLLIAAIAIDNRVPVLHKDAHFELIAKHTDMIEMSI